MSEMVDLTTIHTSDEHATNTRSFIVFKLYYACEISQGGLGSYLFTTYGIYAIFHYYHFRNLFVTVGFGALQD